MKRRRRALITVLRRFGLIPLCPSWCSSLLAVTTATADNVRAVAVQSSILIVVRRRRCGMCTAASRPVVYAGANPRAKNHAYSELSRRAEQCAGKLLGTESTSGMRQTFSPYVRECP